jgi:S1-C subfamily serine protease
MHPEETPPPTRPFRPWPLLVTATLLGTSALVVHRLGGLRDRIEQVEDQRLAQVSDLREQLDGVRGELSGIRTELGTAFDEIEGADQLSMRLGEAEKHLGSIGEAIEAHSSSLVQLEEAQATIGPGLEEELRERDERLLQRYEALNELVTHAQQAASESKDRLEQLDQLISTPPDMRALWRELVGPVVQLAGESSVGSGVLLPSRPAPDVGGYRTYILTAWHVVRDIQGDPPVLEMPVPVQLYREDASRRSEKAHLLDHDVRLDTALLELITPDQIENGARLALREHLENVRIFDSVVAVGCPLGNDPIPTRGEIATCHHEVDGETYWMINAPTYIGNSGGGIFDSRTHELVGIFSKIYTHGSLRPTIVPHMGLVTPMTKVYDWLVQAGYGDLIPRSPNTSGAVVRSGG